jgi:hypothetical protein
LQKTDASLHFSNKPGHKISASICMGNGGNAGHFRAERPYRLMPRKFPKPDTRKLKIPLR